MSHIKNFIDFLREGAVYNADKDGALISFAPHKGNGNIVDVLDTAHGSNIKVTGKKFKLFYGLESPTSSDTKNVEVKTLMDLMKAGKIEVEDPRANGQSQAIFNFIKNNVGSEINNVKYIVMAESQDELVNMMAESLKENLNGSKIIYLTKAEYSNPSDILKDKYKQEFSEDKKELAKQLDDVLAREGHIDKTKRSRNELIKLFDELKTKSVKITSYLNHVRQFLNTKYRYNEEMVEALQKCFLKSNNEKMIIIDDNVHSGTDAREIFGMVEHYFDIQNEIASETIKKSDKDVQHRLWGSLMPVKENVFGFVMYKIKGRNDKGFQ